MIDFDALGPGETVALVAIALVLLAVAVRLFGGRFGIEVDISSDGGDGGGD